MSILVCLCILVHWQGPETHYHTHYHTHTHTHSTKSQLFTTQNVALTSGPLNLTVTRRTLGAQTLRKASHKRLTHTHTHTHIDTPESTQSKGRQGQLVRSTVGLSALLKGHIAPLS